MKLVPACACGYELPRKRRVSVLKGKGRVRRPKVWRGIGCKDRDQWGNDVLFVHYADNKPLPGWMDRCAKGEYVCLLDIVARQRRPRHG